MKEIRYKGKIIRFSGYEIKGNSVHFQFGGKTFSIPLEEFKKLKIGEV